MRAIVTVVGKDKPGIIAGVCVLFAEKNVNILDISQTVMDDFFTMTMLTDLSEMSVSFSELCDLLDDKGTEMEVKIRLQREDIFDKMHRI